MRAVTVFLILQSLTSAGGAPVTTTGLDTWRDPTQPLYRGGPAHTWDDLKAYTGEAAADRIVGDAWLLILLGDALGPAVAGRASATSRNGFRAYRLGHRDFRATWPARWRCGNIEQGAAPFAQRGYRNLTPAH